MTQVWSLSSMQSWKALPTLVLMQPRPWHGQAPRCGSVVVTAAEEPSGQCLFATGPSLGPPGRACRLSERQQAGSKPPVVLPRSVPPSVRPTDGAVGSVRVCLVQTQPLCGASALSPRHCSASAGSPSEATPPPRAADWAVPLAAAGRAATGPSGRHHHGLGGRAQVQSGPLAPSCKPAPQNGQTKPCAAGREDGWAWSGPGGPFPTFTR